MSFAILAGVSSALSVISAGSQRDAAIEANATKYGTDLASKEYRENTATSAAQENIKVAQANAGASAVSIQMNEMATEAKQTSAQAASGVEGGSADAVLNQTERNAAIAQEENTQALVQKESQINAQAADTMIGIETQLGGDAPENTSSNKFLFGALSGLSTYGQLGGFS